MALPKVHGKEEETRNLHRMLHVFACKHEDWTEDNKGLDMAPSPDGSGDDTKEAFGLTLKGT